MSGSTFGKNFTVTTWGESHGPAIGVVIDGCPAGIGLKEEDIQRDMDRRKPGGSPFSTARGEKDQARIMSGVWSDLTTGAPISVLIYNTGQRSKDYDELAKVYRPGHADYTYDKKYGFRDYRGGGRSSGRETACRVAGGAVAKKFLDELGICVRAYVIQVGNVRIDRERFDLSQASANPFCMPDRLAYQQASSDVAEAMKDGDSLGGVVECVITGVPPGVGEPVFDKLSAVLGQAVMSINAVKGVEIGQGFASAEKKGSENNDRMFMQDGAVQKQSNNAGGIYGGITDGSDILLRAAFKPTASIFKTQQTVTTDLHNAEINVKGRHDPLIAPRAAVVVEAMSALATADLLLQNLCSNIQNIKKIYSGVYNDRR